jgi:hypothetical protein
VASRLSFDGTDSSGSFTVTGDIDQYKLASGGGNTSPSLTITNYASVSISGTLRTETTGYTGGAITIAGIAGDISVSNINANGSTDGAVTLANTSGGGVIRVGNLDMNQVGVTVLNAGGGSSYINNLLNFPTNSPTTSGLSAGGDGKFIYYDAWRAANLYLADAGSPLGTYDLGAGNGVLTLCGEGSVFRFR